MQKIRMFAIGCGTVALALVAGHFLQSANVPDTSAAARASQVPEADVAQGGGSGDAQELTPIRMISAMPPAPSDTPTPARLPATPQGAVQLAALGDTAAVMTDALPTEVAAPSQACDYTLTADAAPGAMVALFLDAPCARGQRFTMHHNGLMFTHATDPAGHASMLVPALAKTSVFIVNFPSGDSAVASTNVASLNDYQRVAIQWQGDSGVQLHALEFGAEMGSDGHVWAAARRDVAATANDDRGFMTLLGDAAQPEALIAEVYTFPTRLSGRGGSVALRIDVEVIPANCARDIEAQVLQTRPGGGLNVRELTLAVPECDAVGDFLVLKNLLNDITIARN